MLNEWKIGLDGFAVGFWQSMRAMTMLGKSWMEGDVISEVSSWALLSHPLADIAGI